MSIVADDAGSHGEVAIVTPRGDVVATVTIPSHDASAGGLDSWTRFTEYGQPVGVQPVGMAGAAGNGYGWLGAKQRTTTSVGLLLMGARLYNPSTGLFTSDDPVYGGNDTPYIYPNDPVGNCDLSDAQSCSSMAATLGRIMDELRKRNNEAFDNNRNLPVTGKMSIEEHRQAYNNKQGQLTKEVARFEKKCAYSRFGKSFKSNVRYWQQKKIASPWNMKYYSKGRYSPSAFRSAHAARNFGHGGAMHIRGGGAARPWATK